MSSTGPSHTKRWSCTGTRLVRDHPRHVAGGSFPYTIGLIEHAFRMRPDLVVTDNPRKSLDRLHVDLDGRSGCAA
jgi:hypothetical protein